ncbi:MAG: hypothetical protein JKY26_01550 [Pseudomonas sp.]|nr:hypothetical protein [Pseudomonas sp.]
MTKEQDDKTQNTDTSNQDKGGSAEFSQEPKHGERYVFDITSDLPDIPPPEGDKED